MLFPKLVLCCLGQRPCHEVVEALHGVLARCLISMFFCRTNCFCLTRNTTFQSTVWGHPDHHWASQIQRHFRSRRLHVRHWHEQRLLLVTRCSGEYGKRTPTCLPCKEIVGWPAGDERSMIGGLTRCMPRCTYTLFHRWSPHV